MNFEKQTPQMEEKLKIKESWLDPEQLVPDAPCGKMKLIAEPRCQSGKGP
jgi:hypothetical protein